ncbi:bestrophin-like protein [Gracilaria domingensis]|nr:bestrophin-like protein [Gracilaria domingensis]
MRTVVLFCDCSKRVSEGSIHYRYVHGLEVWLDEIIGYTHLLSSRIVGSYRSGTWHEGDLERIAGDLAAFSWTTAGALRGLAYEDNLKELFAEGDVRRVLSSKARPDHCVDVIRGSLIESEAVLNRSPEGNGCSSVEHCWLLWYLQAMLKHSMACHNIVKVPLPFRYVQHIRIFLVLWLLMLPLGLVESTRWISILWIVFISYGVVGVEHWAPELANPFGFDLSDLPLDALCHRAVAIVKTNLDQFKNGLAPFIRRDRCGFPGQPEE